MEMVPQPEMIPQSAPIQEQDPSVNEIALILAQTLGETDQAAQEQLQRIVWALGGSQCYQLLEQTLQIEHNGGMMLRDGSRRRTPGGVFFYLAFGTGQPQEGRRLERPVYKKPKKEKQAQQQPIPAFLWNNRIAAVKEAEVEKGQANVKITVIGRPGKVLGKGSCIVTVMESTKVPTLPKGLPTPTNVVTKYAVYIASKQWKKVEEAIRDPEDSLIVEGFPKTDPQVSAIAVFATNVTTKKLQMAKKQPQVPQ
jgi:PHAX RNA-binding domain